MSANKTLPQKLFRYLLAWPIAIILAIYALIWLISPSIIYQQVNSAIEPLGYELGEDSHFRFNPFMTKLSAKNLELITSDSKVKASIGDIEVNIDTFKLVDQIVYIDLIRIDNSKLEIKREPEQLIVAGYPIPLNSEEVEQESESTEELAWSIVLANFDIKQFETTFIDQVAEGEQVHSLVLEQLALDNLKVDTNSQKGQLNIAAKINEAQLTTAVDLDLKDSAGEVSVELAIGNLKPNKLNYILKNFMPDPQNDSISGKFDFSSKQVIKLAGPNAIDIAIEELSLNSTDLLADTSGVKASVGDINLQLQDAEIGLSSGELSKLTLMPSLAIRNIAVNPSNSEDVIVAISEIALPEISISQQEAKEGPSSPNVLIPNLKFNSITASTSLDYLNAASLEKDKGSLFSGEGLEITNLLVTDQSMSIQDVILKSFYTSVPVSKEKQLLNLVLPAESAKTPTAEKTVTESSAQTEQTAENQFPVIIQNIALSGTGTIQVDDHSVSPEYSETIVLDKINLGTLNTADSNAFTPFSSLVKVGKYGSVEASGQVTAFSEKLNLDLNTSIRELALPKISPYLRDAAGIDILAGQFDLDNQVKIIEDELDGESTLILRGIEVESAKDVKKGNLSEQSFIPLNLALGALKDSDGNIEIDVGLSGNINDPNVGLDGFIYLIAQKAVLSAAESYAINTFVPYANIFSLARTAGSFVLKVRIDDLNYAERAIELDAKQQEFVNNLGLMMQEKKDLNIKVCPISTVDDLPKEKVANADLSNPEVVKALKAIATQRGETLKETLINTHNIESSRLLLCQARVDGQEEALPRIEFSI